MTVKTIVQWSIAGAVSSTGVGYALYEIKDGQVVDASDVNLDGMTDEHRIDTDGDGIADMTLVDEDFNGTFETLEDAETGETLAEGGFFEGVVQLFANMFSE